MSQNARQKILIHLQLKKNLNPHAVAQHSKNETDKYDEPYRTAALLSALHTRIPIFGRTQTSCNSTHSDTTVQIQTLKT
jgi:hypothetical protein